MANSMVAGGGGAGVGQFASEWGTWKTGRGCRNAASFLNSAEHWDAGFGFILVQTQGRSPLDQHRRGRRRGVTSLLRLLSPLG